MPQSIINTKNPNNADIVLLGANYDKTSSFGKGANKGPRAIVGCLDTQIEFYERFTGTIPVANHKIAYSDLGDLNTLSPEQMVRKVGAEFEKYYSKNKFAIILGGEHSVSNGAFQVLSRSEKPQDITILQIDAHTDMRDTDEDYNDEPYGKYAHACVMRRACELGFPLVQVGIRAYSKEEHDFFSKKESSKIFEWGKSNVSPQAIVNAIATKKVYFTLDVDGIDPSCMPATGTPVQGGLDWYYALRLISLLFQKKEVVGADIVEVAPVQNSHLTEYGAAQIVYNMIAHKMKTK